GFALPLLYQFCEFFDIEYALGIPANCVFKQRAEPRQKQLQRRYRRTQLPQKSFSSFRHRARSWPRQRRICYKAEHTLAGTNLRFLITNCDGPASEIFAFYNDRGECENRIEEFKNGFRADRLSCHRFLANAFRLFLHDVEESDLDFAGEIGKLVDGENAAVGPRQQAVVDGELVGDVLTAAGGLDGVDIADHVGDVDIRGGQLFHVAVVAVEPGDGRVAGLGGYQIAAAAANRGVRVVVNFAAGEVGRPFVEQGGELADETGLGLAAQSKEYEVVARQDGVDHLGDDGILVSDDAGKKRLPTLNFTDQVLAEFVFDAAAGQFGLGKLTGAKRREGTGQILSDLGQVIPPYEIGRASCRARV